MSVKPEDFIGGAAQVVDYYDLWPGFHDADYVSIQLKMDGPTISINFRLYDWDEDMQKADRPSITLEWGGVADVNLFGIEELGQNAVGQMKVSTGNEGITTLILPTGSGTTVKIQASRLEVTHFDPYEEWNYETRNTAFD